MYINIYIYYFRTFMVIILYIWCFYYSNYLRLRWDYSILKVRGLISIRIFDEKLISKYKSDLLWPFMTFDVILHKLKFSSSQCSLYTLYKVFKTKQMFLKMKLAKCDLQRPDLWYLSSFNIITLTFIKSFIKIINAEKNLAKITNYRSSIFLHQGKGKLFRNIQTTGRWHYSALIVDGVSMYWLVPMS